MPEFIDRVFTKTSRKRSFLVIENERFGLVFTKTGSINSGPGPLLYCIQEQYSSLMNPPYVYWGRGVVMAGQGGGIHGGALSAEHGTISG